MCYETLSRCCLLDGAQKPTCDETLKAQSQEMKGRHFLDFKSKRRKWLCLICLPFGLKIYSSPVKKNRVTLSLKCASFSFIFGLFKNEIIFTTNTCAKLGCRHSTVDSSVAFHSAAPGLSPKHTIYALIIYSQICAMFVM